MALFSANLSSELKLYLELTQVSQNQAQNTSQVRARLYISGTGNGAWSNWTTGGYMTLNGAKYNFSLSSYNFSGTINQVLLDKTVTVTNDSNGNATVIASGYFNPDNPSWLSPATVDGSLALTQIKRADVVYNNTYTAGDAGFKIDVTSKFGLATKYVVRLAVGGVSFNYELPNVTQNSYVISPTQAQMDSFYTSAGPSVTQVTYAAVLETWNGTVKIGETIDYATIIFPETALPNLNDLTLGTNVREINTTVSNVVGNNTTFIALISQIRVEITGATALYGATIANYEITIKNSSEKVVNSFTTPYVILGPNSADTLTIYARVKDSRGRWSAYKTLLITVLPYHLPSISKNVVNRANADGTLNILGTSLKCDIAGSVASIIVGGVEKNKLSYRIDDVTAGTVNKVPSTAVVSLNFNVTKIIGTYSIDQVYTIQLTVTDAFGRSATNSFTVPIAQVPMTWGKRGIGAGGIYSESDPIGVGLQVYNTAHFLETAAFEKKITVEGKEVLTIIERNGDEATGYEKYSNGKQVTWKTVSLTVTSFPNSLGGGYYSNAISLGPQPAAFVDDNINTTTYITSTTVLTTADFSGANKTSLGNVFVGRIGSSSAQSFVIKIRCEGRWK